jgi:hypothetical protein
MLFVLHFFFHLPNPPHLRFSTSTRSTKASSRVAEVWICSSIDTPLPRRRAAATHRRST